MAESPTINARQETLMVYIIFVVSLFLSTLVAVIGVVYAYVRRGDFKGTLYESHLNYLIRLFWWQLALSLVPLLMVAYGLVWPLLLDQLPRWGWTFGAMACAGLIMLWFLVKLLLGLVRLQDGRAMS